MNRYSKLLAAEGHGNALWVPEPDNNLPLESREKGVSIGDVGMLNVDGGFDFLFNVFLPASDPINARGVPENFEPLKLCGEEDLAIQPGMFPPRTVIGSPGFRLGDTSEVEEAL